MKKVIVSLSLASLYGLFLNILPVLSQQKVIPKKPLNSVLACFPGTVYKNSLAVITKVYPPTEADPIFQRFYGNNTLLSKYVYDIRDSRGVLSQLYVVFRKDLSYKPQVGMYYFWTEAPKAVRNIFPNEKQTSSCHYE